MPTCFECPKHSQWIINNEIWIDGKRLSSAPKRKNGKTSSTVIDGKVYVNGYEYFPKQKKWKRTFSAIWHYLFQNN